jgi:hypothetical protein
MAKAASEQNRPGWDQLISSWAALIGPIPDWPSRSEDYCEREVDEVEWQGGRVYLHLGGLRAGGGTRTPNLLLQDSSGPSTAYWPVLSLLLRLGGPSGKCAAVRPSSGWWNVDRNDIAGCSTRLITYLLHRMGSAVVVRALCHHAWMTFDQSG